MDRASTRQNNGNLVQHDIISITFKLGVKNYRPALVAVNAICKK
jgi:hypothetical protein